MKIIYILASFMLIQSGCIKQEKVLYIDVPNQQKHCKVILHHNNVATAYNPANEYRDTFNWIGSYSNGDTITGIWTSEPYLDSATISYKVRDSFLVALSMPLYNREK